MYSTTDPGLPFGQGDIQSENHDFGLNINREHLKRKWEIQSIMKKTNIASKRILYPY